MNQLLSEYNGEILKRIKSSAFFVPMAEKVKEAAEIFLTEPTESLKYSDFSLYYTTGNRYVYENKYFRRRGKLNAYALMYLLTNEKKYKEALEDIIWAICDEFTWALPAHVSPYAPLENQSRWIDLFASETGYALSELNHIMGHMLSEPVQKRLVSEVRRRIITSYLTRLNECWWETSTNNWAAVCAGSVGIALMYLGTPEEFEEAKPRLLDTIDCFLSGFGNDGCCLEGYSYWQYGFGFYTQFAALLRQYTDGKIDLFSGEKVKKIAQFPQKIMLGEDHCVSFSDGGMYFTHSIGLTHFLHKEFDIEIPDNKYISLFGSDHCYRWGSFIRDYLWADETLPAGTICKKSYYMEDAAWFVHRGEHYSLAAKAGDNNEPHNHNDIGSFVLDMDGEFILYDLGAGEYTADYFNPDRRYSYLVNSSRGHSVPIIDGQYQKEGASYHGTVILQTEYTFAVDLSKAYDLPRLTSLQRRFDCLADGIILTDSYTFAEVPVSVTERFVTIKDPVVSEGLVQIGNRCIRFDATALCCSVTTEDYSDHRANMKTVYLIDFAVQNPSKAFSCEFHFE